MQSQKSNMSSEPSKSKKSSKNMMGTIDSKKGAILNAESPSNLNSQKILQKKISNSRLHIQIDSDLLYGSTDMNANEIQYLDKIPQQQPVSNKATSDSHGFDTFGDSDNRKITAISEL